MAPLLVSADFGANEHCRYIRSALEWYGKSTANIIALVGDNTNVNPAIAAILGCSKLVETSWLQKMILKLLVRFAQLFAMAPETCAENMSKGLTEASWRGGFRVMSPSATAGVTTAAHTPEVREKVWQHTLEVLQRALR